MEKNLYKILEIPPTASQADIKKAYKRLAKAMHPDAHQGSAVYEEKFKEINHAYQILKNAESRRDYDRKHSHHAAPNPDFRTWSATQDSNKKSAGDFWTKHQQQRQSQRTAGHQRPSSSPSGSGSRPAAEADDDPPARKYREPWSGPEPMTVLKAIVLLTILAPLGIGLSERRAHISTPAVVVATDPAPEKTVRPELKKSEKSATMATAPARKVYKPELTVAPLPEMPNREPDSNEIPFDESEVPPGKTTSATSSDELLESAAKERALFEDMMECNGSGEADRCYDLATTGIETFTDRSKAGTAYLVRFIMAYNLDKSDRTMDLFYEMMELEEQNKILLSPNYIAQAWPVALNLTVVLNDRQSYFAMRDNAVQATEAFAQYAEDVSETIRTAESVKGWVAH